MKFSPGAFECKFCYAHNRAWVTIGGLTRIKWKLHQSLWKPLLLNMYSADVALYFLGQGFRFFITLTSLSKSSRSLVKWSVLPIRMTTLQATNRMKANESESEPRLSQTNPSFSRGSNGSLPPTSSGEAILVIYTSSLSFQSLSRNTWSTSSNRLDWNMSSIL